MRTDIRHSILILTMLLLCILPGVIHARQAAGITPDRATRVSAPTTLTVQSGSNYIRLESANLPATVTYVADTAFGPLPMALVMGDTLDAQMVFDTCHMTWRWSIEQAESDKIVEIKAHENASIVVAPHVCEVTYSDTTAILCGESFVWRGTTYTESGDYPITLVNAEGCDSIRTLKLTLNKPTHGEETLEECDSLFWHGEWYKESGDYTFETTNVAGCDSTVTLHLTVHPSYHITLPDTTGCLGNNSDGYWFIDTLITTPGIYTRHKKTIWGCDSILTQYVAIAEETYGTDMVTAYDSYTWIDGNTYYAPTGAIAYLTNVAGCDSIVSLNLTIRHIAVNDTVKEAVCLATGESYTWKGKTYTESGTYTTDTLLGPKVNKIYMDTLHTLVLTVNRTYAVDTIVSVCADEYTWRGTTYTENGSYPYAGKTIALCDSIVTLRLTLKQATAGEQTETAYESYKWHGITYTESGDYTFETKNVAGCDSVATLHLTILPKPIVYDTITEYFCPKSGIVEHVDTLSDPHVRYLAYVYEKPRAELYMDGVLSDETSAGANVNFERVLSNLDAYYIAPLTPVELINWRYMPTGGQYETLTPGAGPQWMNAGIIAMDVVFRCGYRYYSAFTVGKMTEEVATLPVSDQPIKRIENGQVVILRGGVKYTVFGTRIE